MSQVSGLKAMIQRSKSKDPRPKTQDHARLKAREGITYTQFVF